MVAEIREDKGKGDPRLLVITPYHPEAVIAFRNLMGKWDGINRWWVILPEHRNKVEAIIRRLWPPEEEKVSRIYRFSSEGSSNSPVLDHLEVTRKMADIICVVHPNVIEVLENDLIDIGSRRYMKLRGTLVVRARVRPEATAEWIGGTVVLIDDPAERLLRQVFEGQK